MYLGYGIIVLAFGTKQAGGIPLTHQALMTIPTSPNGVVGHTDGILQGLGRTMVELVDCQNLNVPKDVELLGTVWRIQK